MAEENKTHWAKWKCMTCGKENTTAKMGMNHCKCMGSGVDLNEYFIGTRYLDAENLGHSDIKTSNIEKVKKQYLDAMMDDAKDTTLRTIMAPKEVIIPKWVERELFNHARNNINTHNSEYDMHVDIAFKNGMEAIRYSETIEEAFIKMNLYLSTID